MSDLAEFFVLMLEIRYKKLFKTENITEKQKDILLKIKEIVVNRLQERNMMLIPLTIRLIIIGNSLIDTTDNENSDF